MNQEVSVPDKQGVIEGFANMGNEISRAVSEIVKEKGSPRGSLS